MADLITNVWLEANNLKSSVKRLYYGTNRHHWSNDVAYQQFLNKDLDQNYGEVALNLKSFLKDSPILRDLSINYPVPLPESFQTQMDKITNYDLFPVSSHSVFDSNGIFNALGFISNVIPLISTLDNLDTIEGAKNKKAMDTLVQGINFRDAQISQARIDNDNLIKQKREAGETIRTTSQGRIADKHRTEEEKQLEIRYRSFQHKNMEYIHRKRKERSLLDSGVDLLDDRFNDYFLGESRRDL